MSTLKDVAERAGVTVTTVSRMLNGHDCVSPATREKISQAMREIGYFPNEMARSLSKKQSNFIGLIVPTARHSFFADLIHYTEAAAQEQGCKIAMYGHTHEAEYEETGGVKIINPGTAGKGRFPTWALVEVLENGGITCEIRNI